MTAVTSARATASSSETTDEECTWKPVPNCDGIETNPRAAITDVSANTVVPDHPTARANGYYFARAPHRACLVEYVKRAAGARGFAPGYARNCFGGVRGNGCAGLSAGIFSHSVDIRGYCHSAGTHCPHAGDGSRRYSGNGD